MKTSFLSEFDVEWDDNDVKIIHLTLKKIFINAFDGEHFFFQIIKIY